MQIKSHWTIPDYVADQEFGKVIYRDDCVVVRIKVMMVNGVPEHVIRVHQVIDDVETCDSTTRLTRGENYLRHESKGNTTKR